MNKTPIPYEDVANSPFACALAITFYPLIASSALPKINLVRFLHQQIGPPIPPQFSRQLQKRPPSALHQWGEDGEWSTGARH